MTTTPAPLTPADCNLQDFAFIPIDCVRLRDSGLAVEATGDEFRAAVLLWAASWHQVPAASVPDDDRALCAFAGYGRDLSKWRKLRKGALRGFVKCSDGRLYHPVVASKAVEAWASKQEQRAEREAEADRQRRHRELRASLFSELRELNSGSEDAPPWNISTQELKKLVEKAKKSQTCHAPVTVTGETCHADVTVAGNAPATAIKGQGQGQGQGQGYSLPQPPPPPESNEDVGWTLEQCKAAAAGIGMTDEQVLAYWQARAGVGWVDAAGRKITNLAANMGRWKAQEVNHTPRAATRRGRLPAGAPPEPMCKWCGRSVSICMDSEGCRREGAKANPPQVVA